MCRASSTSHAAAGRFLHWIELLVVIAIIAQVLVVLLTRCGRGEFLGTQPVANTRIVLKSSWTGFHKKFVEVIELAAQGDEA